MKLQEYHARKLLGDAGVPFSRGRAVFNSEEVASAYQEFANPRCVVKVQVLAGGRGKAGGVKVVSSAGEARSFCDSFLGKKFFTPQSAGSGETVRAILVTENIPIQKEFYLGIAVDRSRQKPVIIFSGEGGVEIEEVAKKKPEAILKIHFSPSAVPAKENLLPQIESWPDCRDIAGPVADIAAKLTRFFVEKDVSLCEINPLALTPNGVIALDAKIVFDDNALFRHPELRMLKDPEEEDERERKAKEFGLSYVSMGGNIGCLVNGAGLAMATMDVIKLAGGEPANFLDVGGGATADQVREGFKIILQDERVEAILVNIFGGIMKCDVIAEGVIQASREVKLEVPLVVRLEGTRVEEGRALLKNSGLSILSCTTIQEAAQMAVKGAYTRR